MEKLLFINKGYGNEAFWKNELASLSKEFEVDALSYNGTMKTEYDCKKYHSYFGNSSIAILGGLFSFFLSKEGHKEIADIIRKHKKNAIVCILKSVRYYSDMRQFGKYVENNIKDVLENSIVYTYWCAESTLYFALNKEKYHISKLVTRMHGCDLYEERREEGRQPFRWLINEKADLIVVCGNNNKEYYLKTHLGVDADRMIVNRLGCKQRGINPYKKSDKFVLVSCSLIKELKRVNLIVEALSMLEDVSIKWIHFGENQIGNEFVELCKSKLDDKRNIEYVLMGQVPNEQVIEYYLHNSVDAFITTSSSEGAPVSIMEAMSFGIPIIGTAVGDIPSMIKGNGYLLDANPSVMDIAASIKTFNKLDGESKRKMREHSFEVWNDYYNSDKNVRDFIEKLK